MAGEALYLGIDVGTSGVRGVLIDAGGARHADASVPLPPPSRDAAGIRQDPAVWWQAVLEVLHALPALDTVRAVAIDGTSGTLAVCGDRGEPLAPARMYNDQTCIAAAAEIDAHSPADSIARGASSTLARLLSLLEETGDQARYALHQADWLAARLTGVLGRSDANNCLKLGYDVAHQCWPAWMRQLGFDMRVLPAVASPGDPIGPVCETAQQATGLPATCLVVSGTTDGNAAFAAAGEFEAGVAVTSLGSTLTVKLVSIEPVFAPEYGVYSHRFLGHWLAGGASNTGGAALARFFEPAAIEAHSLDLDPTRPTDLDYYPLPGVGERFPTADPEMVSRTEPRPADDARFLQGLLEGIARIERDAYARLAELGATTVTEVRTTGGGASNDAWTRIRANALGVPVRKAEATDAAYGTARLALAGWRGREIDWNADVSGVSA